jgi:hypothetical protein
MKTPQIVLVALTAGFFSAPGAELADPLQSAKEDLWAARWEYRYPFVCTNNVAYGDFDALRTNWAGTGLEYDVRNLLWRARDGFAAFAEQTESQEARAYLAETVNELLCGHLTDGNYLLIEALKARYPFLASSSTEPERPPGDTWALKANGSLDAEVQDIDKALIQFGIGIKAVARLLDRPDIVRDRYSGLGILRSSCYDIDAYANFPNFARLKDGFRNPDAGYQSSDPKTTPVQVEFYQLTAITERRAQALFEKGNKYFQVSGQKTGSDRAEQRRKAKETLKVGHHSSYLLAAALGSLQSSEDYEANKGTRINVFADQMREFYRNLEDPSFQPFGKTDQFIPPTDKPVSFYIADALSAAQEAITSEQDYRNQLRENNNHAAELAEFVVRTDEYLDQLGRLTGFTDAEITDDYRQLRTVDQQRAFRKELENRVGQLLARPYEPGSVPSVNLGDFGVQILNVLDAQYRIQQAFNTLQHIPARIQIEQDRSSSVIRIIYDATRKMNATEIALAYASSYNVSASSTVSLPPSFTVSVGFNPLAALVGILQMTRNNIQANQQAGIEGANSVATVRNILLDMDNAVIDLDRAKVLFDQENTKLKLLFADVNKMIEDYSECVGLQKGATQLRLDNPEYRRWLNDSFKRADARRQEAAIKLYQLGRALEFWWTEAYANPVVVGAGQQGVALDRYNSVNFPDLLSVFSITTANQLGDFYLLLKEWDDVLRAKRTVNHQYSNTRSYSLRDDVLFKDLAQAGVSLTRRIRDFRDYICANAYYGPGSTPATRPGFRLDFPISLESLDARQDWNIRVGYRTDYGGLKPGVQVRFEADAMFNGYQNDVQVDLTYFGVVSTTTYFNDPMLAKPSVIKWNLPAPDSPFAENRDALAATFPASINGLTRVDKVYLSQNLCGKPIAATNWRLTLDPSRGANSEVDISKVRDVILVITECTGKPVDPATGAAYYFPGL